MAPPAAASGFLPWFGLLGGMGAWLVHLVTTYFLVPFQCGNAALFHGLTAGLGAVALAAAWAAWREARRQPEEGRAPGRRRFMGRTGILLSAFFVGVILAEAAPIFLQDPCLIPGPRIASAAVPAARLAPREAGFPVPGELWGWWSWKAWVLAPLAAALTAYSLGLLRLWRRAGVGSGVSVGRAGCYGGGLAALFVALVSPVDAWGAALFSAHMVQHLLIMVVAAPLLVLGSPVVAGMWALPAGARRRVAAAWNGAPALRAAWSAVRHPVSVWLLHVFALWTWHVPRLYEAALGSEVVHVLQHATFFASALLFWDVLARARVHRWFGYGAGVLYVFAGAVQSGVLGALLTFAPRPWYGAHLPGAVAWGLTGLEDQQLAGLIMWVPAGVIYVAAALLLFLGWLAAAERRMGASSLRPAPGASPARAPGPRTGPESHGLREPS